MFGFKVFNFNSIDQNIEAFTKEVNEFLEQNEIEDIKLKEKTENVSNWSGYTMVHFIHYIIKYKSKNEEK